MMAPRTEALKPVVLLVEGISDKYLLTKLITTRKLPETSMLTCDGQSNLNIALADLEIRLQGIADSSNASNIRNIAIVFDMEADANKTQNLIKTALRHKPLNSPCHTYLLGDKHLQSGCFETLCLESIAAADPLLTCAKELLNCVESNAQNVAFNRSQQDKATLQAYAITRKELRNKAHNVIDFMHPCFDELAQFIQSLHKPTP